MSYYLEALRTKQPLNVATMRAAQAAYDNRAEPETADADDTDPVAASDAAMEMAGRADRAWQSGDKAAAADLYRSAAAMLVSAAEVAGA
jgi:hypothetical protein